MAFIAMVMSMCTMPGQSVGVSAFNQSFRTDLQISASQLAGAYALGTILASLLLPFAGAAIDRFGLRRSLFFVIPALFSACFFVSTVHSLLSLFAAFFLLRLFGQGTLSLCAQNTLAMWFSQRLGRVNGIATTFVTFFMAASPLLLRVAIVEYGWRTTYRGLGAIVVVILLPLMIVYRNRPEDLNQLPDGFSVPLNSETSAQLRVTGLSLSEAMRESSYWILIFLQIIWSLVGTSLIFDVQSLGHAKLNGNSLQVAWGEIPTEAANTFFFASIGIMIFVGGFLADKFLLSRLLRISILGMVIGLLILVLGNGAAFFVAYCVYGLAQGLLVAVSGTIWPRFFGRAHLGKIRGGAMMAMVAGSSLGPLITGFAFDRTGSFQIPLVTFTILTFAGLVAACFVSRPDLATD